MFLLHIATRDKVYKSGNFTDRSVLIRGLRHLSVHLLLGQECSSFRLMEALCSFSSAYLDCQHLHSCALGPSLRKRRVTRTQAPRCRDSWSDDPDGYWVTNGWGAWVTSRDGTESIALLNVVCHLKLTISGIFHLVFLDHDWPPETESETANNGGLLH